MRIVGVSKTVHVFTDRAVPAGVAAAGAARHAAGGVPAAHYQCRQVQRHVSRRAHRPRDRRVRIHSVVTDGPVASSALG